MTLPASWQTVRVFGTYKRFDTGEAAHGAVTFEPVLVTAPEGAGRTVVLPKPRTVALDVAGKIDIQLPATDDPDIAPTGWAYRVTEKIGRNEARAYFIHVPLAGGDIDLATAPPVVPVKPMVAYLSSADIGVSVASQAAATSLDARVDALEASPSGGAWGTITGTLSAQTDLQAALDGKATAAQGAKADSAIQDAPNDGGVYVRQNNSWKRLYAPLTATGALMGGTVGEPYAGSLTIAGGLAPYAVYGYLLPPGLTPAVAGATINVTGTPTVEWTAPGYIDVLDSLGTIVRAITSPVVGSSFTPISATGGTITDTTIGGRAWRYHTFTASGNFVVSSLGTDPNVTYLAVGSGASGGHHDFVVGVGGGAGGMVRTSTFVPSVTTYPIVIGAAGAAVTGTSAGAAGSNVTGLGVTAEGGSGGGTYFVAAGNGTNGGGGGCNATIGPVAGGTGTNFAGGNGRGNTNSSLRAGGGGAGAGGAGGNAADSLGGTGGNGVASSITGASVYYGAGAGGGAETTGGSAGLGGVAGVGFNIAPNAGTDGRGNGGSGASGTGAGVASGAGGKGVFIIGYWTAAA